MKKFIFALVSLMMSISASAFDFDGIDLNGNAVEITRQIGMKGYVYDDTRDCLRGECKGNEIYLSINYNDVTEKNKIGQLIVDIPLNNMASSFETAVKIFNVVYHQTEKVGDSVKYTVSEDGTQLVVSPAKDYIRLTYNTPFYNKK